jgi:hypothetical protein
MHVLDIETLSNAVNQLPIPASQLTPHAHGRQYLHTGSPQIWSCGNLPDAVGCGSRLAFC